ncbi:MAG: hypothetical protein F9K23_12280 [Bacteroidetes bacterium]|nr:MAG: hypothetical protein F9K23_12280 [Bacteroidota bacterium]
MEYKYYTAVCFDTLSQAADFSQSYHHNSLAEGQNTRYRFPVSQTEQGTFCVVVYDLNELTEHDIQRITIQKISTDFIPLD